MKHKSNTKLTNKHNNNPKEIINNKPTANNQNKHTTIPKQTLNQVTHTQKEQAPNQNVQTATISKSNTNTKQIPKTAPL